MIDSRSDPKAASAGGILVTRLWKRGVAGIVTDGGFRDSPEIAKLPFPAYHAAPSAPTNLIRHHAVDLNVPIGCGDVAGLSRRHRGRRRGGRGRDSRRTSPRRSPNEAFEQTVFEDFVQEQVEAGRGIFGLYPPDPGDARGVQDVAGGEGR